MVTQAQEYNFVLLGANSIIIIGECIQSEGAVYYYTKYLHFNLRNTGGNISMHSMATISTQLVSIVAMV